MITEINILRSLPASAHVFQNHLLDLLSDYRKVLIINLVRKSKQEEDKLTQGLVSILKMVKTADSNSIQSQSHDATS